MSTPNISRDTINRVVARLQNDPAFKEGLITADV